MVGEDGYVREEGWKGLNGNSGRGRKTEEVRDAGGTGRGGARGGSWRLAEYRPIAEEKAARVAVAGFC